MVGSISERFTPIRLSLCVCLHIVAAESVDEAGAIPFTHLTPHQSPHFFIYRHDTRQSSQKILLLRTLLQWTLPPTSWALCTS
jgi:hypothetical protein